MADPSGRYLRANPGFLRMVGYNAEEILQKSIGDLSHPDDLPNSWRTFEDLVQGRRNQADYEKRMLRKEDGEIAWDRPAAVLARAVRAYTPWPSAYTCWHGKLLKVVSAYAVTSEPGEEVKPGTVSLRKENNQQILSVATGNGLLIVDKLQLEGKKVMSAGEFVRGYPQIVGEVLG